MSLSEHFTQNMGFLYWAVRLFDIISLNDKLQFHYSQPCYKNFHMRNLNTIIQFIIKLTLQTLTCTTYYFLEQPSKKFQSWNFHNLQLFVALEVRLSRQNKILNTLRGSARWIWWVIRKIKISCNLLRNPSLKPPIVNNSKNAY